MTYLATYFNNAFACFATCLVLGCTSGGTLGCGSSSGGGPTVDSDLPGIYQVNTYQSTSEEDTGADVCDRITDFEPAPSFVVLYGFRPNDDPEGVRLGGTFCTDVDQCRQAAQEASEPVFGYSFRQGSDQAGWLGWGIADKGNAADQCRADVQVHTLTAPGSGAIRIDTETFETTYPPTTDGSAAICSIRAAIDSLTPDLPCKGRFLLEATREASL